MNWLPLNSLSQLDEIDLKSNLSPVTIFKHSTSCSISGMSKMRLEGKWDLDNDAYYLDLIKYRPISQAIAERYHVHHESPQILLIKNGECIYDASHFDITVDELKESLEYHQK